MAEMATGAPPGSVGKSHHGWLPMSFAGGVCPELGFKGKLPRESMVIPIILVKGLHGEPKLAYFVSVAYF